MAEITVWEVARLAGFEAPPLGRRAECPFRHHKRRRSFSVFRAKNTGEVMWKCHSCDAPNVGGAVSLYARLTNRTWREAAVELRSMGYEVGGGRYDTWARDGPDEPAPRRRLRAIAVEGDERGPFAALDLATWARWRRADTGMVARFCAARGLDHALARRLGVVEPGPGLVGFTYRAPETALPCRVKVRAVDRKAFWVEPRGNGLKARSPLYLAHDLSAPAGGRGAVAIVEGEADALALRQTGFRNVVSLPDGADSASTVSVEPVARHFHVWLIGTDDDDPGRAAYEVLRDRAWALGLGAVRVLWRRLEVGDAGEEVVRYKDANDALVGGLVRQDFQHCVARASEQALGYVVMP